MFLFIFIFIVIVIPLTTTVVKGQIPYIRYYNTQTLGQCFSDSDCDVYLQIYPELEEGDIVCNNVYNRCQRPTGEIIGVNTDVVCTFITIEAVAYRSAMSSCPTLTDGMIQVTVTSDPEERLYGVLRLYTTYGIVNHSISDTFVEEQSVNYPETVYYFRGLAPGTFSIRYFDIIGCTKNVVPNPEIVDIFDDSYLPSFSVPCNSDGFFTMTGVFDNVGTPRARRVGLSDSVWGDYIHTTPADWGVGQRVPFIQVFGQSGQLLYTASGSALLMNNTNSSGVAYPLKYTNTSGFFANIYEQTRLAGFATIWVGLGFAYSSCMGCPFNFVRDQLGIYEGYMMAPKVIDLNMHNLGNLTGGYDTSVQAHFRLNGVYTNTRFIYTHTPSVFFGTVDHTNNPIINMVHVGINQTQTENVNSICISSMVTGLNVTLDFTGFPIGGGTFISTLVKIVNQNYQYMNPNQTRLTQTVIWYLITESGIYCSLFAGNALDTHGFRTLLQTCFQVDIARATMTQVRSEIVASQTDVPDYPYTVFGGYGSQVETTFILSLPVTLVLGRDMEPTVLLSIASDDIFFQNQLESLNADTYNIFNDDLGTVDMSIYYNITGYPADYPDYYLFILRQSMINGGHLSMFTPAAASIINTHAAVSLRVLNVTNSSLNDPSVQYSCSTLTEIDMLHLNELTCGIVIRPPLCPNERSIFYPKAQGGICYHMDNPTLDVPGYTLGTAFPFANPCVYYFIFKNYDNTSSGFNHTLAAGMGMNNFNAPSNIPIQMIVRDAVGSACVTTATSNSIISEDATVITFLPFEVVCLFDVQYTVITYSLNRDDEGIIEYWAPLDLTAREIYDPNESLFDIPSDCDLLQNMTAYDVYIFCQVEGAPGENLTQCEGCNRLPIQFPQANGTSLYTAVNNEKWEVIVWVPTEVFNNETGRYYYCRTGKSVFSRVPDPLSFTFSNFRRIQVIGEDFSAQPCQGDTCFAITIDIIIQEEYEELVRPNVILSSFPALDQRDDVYGGLEDNEFNVQLGIFYELTASAAGLMCPHTRTYQPTAIGPLIVLIDSFPSKCGINAGSATMYFRYNDPDVSQSGLIRKMCMYWPGRHFLGQDEAPISFETVVNPTIPQFLPDDGFPEPMRFEGLHAGIMTLMIYDDCNGGFAGTGKCDCLVQPGHFELTNPALRFVYREFEVTNVATEAGSIEISRDEYTEANCYEDSYNFTFTVYDSIGEDGLGYPPYEIRFMRPFDNGIFKTFGSCIPGDYAELPAPVLVGTNRLRIGTFQFELPTGGEFGLGFSGNYTFLVHACGSGCIATYTTYIDIVHPIKIFLTSSGSTCAYKPASLTYSISGGSPYNAANNYDNLTYTIPGSSILYHSGYAIYFKGPLTGGVFLQMFLPALVFAGNYTLKACDKHSCCAEESILIPAVDPITVTLVDFDAVCQDSLESVVRFNISGPDAPFFIFENLTQVTNDTETSAEFVARYNQSHCVHIVNSVGCMLPTPICFQLPDPGPLPLNITSTPSCQDTATGTVEAISDQPIFCSWVAVGASTPSLPICNLDQGLNGGAFLHVTATNIIGCKAEASVTVGTRPRIVIATLTRTTEGYLDGPCIDNITMSISGGYLPPPYLVTLFEDTTNATLIYNASVDPYLITIRYVCRSIGYKVRVRESDGACGKFHESFDAEYDVGFGGQGVDGLPDPTNDFGLCGKKCEERKKSNKPLKVTPEARQATRSGTRFLTYSIIAIMVVLAISTAILHGV